MESASMKELWDKRYASEVFVYGREPNAFFSAQLKNCPPGKILLPGEGEGRNAIYAALQGWTVDAFDQSRVGRDKAIAFAKEQDVAINFEINGAEEFNYKAAHYDMVALIYLHTPAPVRKILHQKVYESLKPGGLLVLEAFHKEQLGRGSGGPGSLEMLLDEESLRADFSELKEVHIEKRKTRLNEGDFHQGEAITIRLTGNKTA